MIEIEKNVPVPERSSQTTSASGKYPWIREMGIGDSVFLPDEMDKEQQGRIRSAIRMYASRCYKAGLIEVDRDGRTRMFLPLRVDGGIRVWRIK